MTVMTDRPAIEAGKQIAVRAKQELVSEVEGVCGPRAEQLIDELVDALLENNADFELFDAA